MPSIRIAVAALVVGAAPVSAQDWPTRPMTMVVTVAAGSGPDTVGRVLATRLSELLGRQVIVENVTGAGGLTGTNRVAKAAPDGYQFMLGTAGTHALNQTLYKKLLYNAATDFAPVALIGDQPFILTARKDFPANDLKEFIAYAKANQAQMQYSSGGTGSGSHVACLLLNAAIGIDVSHIPYRGGGPAMQDMIAGRVDYQCAASSAVPQIESRTVKAIAIMTRNRSPILPGLASAHDQGLADFHASTWFAFFLPKGTPAPIVERLHVATVAVIDTPAVRDRLKEHGTDLAAPERRSPEYLQKFVVSEIEKWAVPIKAAGVSLD